MTSRDPFYDHLPRISDFDQLTQADRFTALPQDWLVGTTDIVNSTGLIKEGRYKTVNMVGAAVISAMMNALDGAAFPFVFGGDGAGFAVPPSDAAAARDALARVARWAKDSFDIEMRVALVPVAHVHAHGGDVRVARFQVSDGVDYAMFDGGGLHWAEAQMKAGNYAIPLAPEGEQPDLTGLSCRWSPMPARNGTILSILVTPVEDAPVEAISRLYDRVVTLAHGLERGGHPVPENGPGFGWPHKGASLEARASRGKGSLGAAWRKAMFASIIAWVLIRTGFKLGEFDARHYARIVGKNADFRKRDDGLKMTLDCDAATQAQIEAVLSAAKAQGHIDYGTATQSHAMMTCIVPSIMTDDHVHFIDGAGGGYTLAASKMKGRV
ncbi:DUF3095 domain-containing protein [Sulfitobacter sp. F26204]|uniref:DUF3095 domain-containing protein n=1 Tax=Sulfitobacter sp. F26204 TaxID=2996014 RepID=UPI00225DD359|nr:DUF3095 domain-containing protein [Sulfitobacter sp. F26204]MCX7558045.1 DUF3095 domain-containing protein [Sulfitobacter sp. F26204]